MVIFDGERICVQLSKSKDWKKVIELAKEYDYCEYLSDVGIYCLPPTKKVARTLKELNYPMDESMNIFFSKTDKKEEVTVKKLQEDFDFHSIDNKDELFEFQKEGVRKMLQLNSNILLADSMGLGKTPQGSMYLRYKENSLPAIVVCPASLKLNWQKEIKHWTGLKSYVINGKTPEYLSDEFLKKYPIWIINYDILGSENKEEKLEEQKRKEAVAMYMFFCSDFGKKALASISDGTFMQQILAKKLKELEVPLFKDDEIEKLNENFKAQIELEKKLEEVESQIAKIHADFLAFS